MAHVKLKNQCFALTKLGNSHTSSRTRHKPFGGSGALFIHGTCCMIQETCFALTKLGNSHTSS